MMSREIRIYESWSSDDREPLGLLHISNSRGVEVCGFEFDQRHLHRNAQLVLDPELMAVLGPQYLGDGGLFWLFGDACPGPWGRGLLQMAARRRFAWTDSDYLLAVPDEIRMGALRFEDEEAEPFDAPTLADLPQLARCAEAVEGRTARVSGKWLAVLAKAASALPCSRPSATVRDDDGALWLAKFPSREDSPAQDAMAWEMVLHDLGAMSGLDVPETRLLRPAGKSRPSKSTLVVKRFDRNGARRVQYASAMNLLSARRGGGYATYLDIADVLRGVGAQPREDLRGLWKRMVFSLLVGNNAHVSDYGFLLDSPNGWRLAPMCGAKPSPYAGGFCSLGITKDSQECSTQLALDTAKHYGLTPNEAKSELESMAVAIHSNWMRLAEKYGIGPVERFAMRPAFQAALPVLNEMPPVPDAPGFAEEAMFAAESGDEDCYLDEPVFYFTEAGMDDESARRWPAGVVLVRGGTAEPVSADSVRTAET